MSSVDKIVGSIIQQKRRMLRLTQTQLGDKIGMAYSTIACYESGTRGMSLDTFFKICEVLSLDPKEVQKQVEDCIERGVDAIWC